MLRRINSLFSDNSLVSEAELLELSSRVVKRYLHSGTIPEREREDVEMEIVEKYLSSKKKIESAFKGNSKPHTYIISVLSRMCVEVIRRNIKRWDINITDHIDNSMDYSNSTDNKFIIQEEVKNLSRIIGMFGEEAPKIRLFLALYYRLPISKIDYINFLGLQNYSEFEILSNDIVVNLNKGEVFKYMTSLINKTEDKDVKPDALRMWLNKTIEAIINRLSPTDGLSVHSKESLAILFEYWYVSNKKKAELSRMLINLGQ
jgi:hypothetical protein